jgi:hypothetical protein
MVIVPHPPYSPDLAPCDFTVSQIENETERTTLWNVSDIKRELQAVLNSIKENYFLGAFKAWKKMMGSLYMFPRRLI